jgi:hypothetical protein
MGIITQLIFIGLPMGEGGKMQCIHLNLTVSFIEGTDNLLKHATDYYKILFGLGEGNKMSLDSNIWSIGERLSVEDNCVLDEPFSESEVKNAIDIMANNKAPGPDGIPIEF